MSTNHAFQPETVEALAMAFQRAWRFMAQDLHFTRTDPALLQARLAACLMELCADGENDPLRLANRAVVRMREECAQRLPVLTANRHRSRIKSAAGFRRDMS